MAGQRRLNRHLGGFQVTDLAHHDDVRVLPHQRADTTGKVELDIMLHLHLVEAVLDHLDRIFNGADIHLGRGQLLQRGVQRGGLAGTGWPGHQHDTIGLADHLLPTALILAGKTQLIKGAQQHVRVEDPHHHLLAKGRGQRRQT